MSTKIIDPAYISTDNFSVYYTPPITEGLVGFYDLTTGSLANRLQNKAGPGLAPAKAVGPVSFNEADPFVVLSGDTWWADTSIRLDAVYTTISIFNITSAMITAANWPAIIGDYYADATEYGASVFVQDANTIRARTSINASGVTRVDAFMTYGTAISDWRMLVNSVSSSLISGWDLTKSISATAAISQPRHLVARPVLLGSLQSHSGTIPNGPAQHAFHAIYNGKALNLTEAGDMQAYFNDLMILRGLPTIYPS